MPFLKISEEIQAKLLKQLQTPEMQEFVAKTVASEDSGRFKIVISTQDEDRQGEIIDQNGWDFTKYLLNPVVLWAHDYKQLPIGVTEKLYKEGTNTIAEGKFAPGDCNPFAQQVRKLYDLGMVRTASVGLIGKQAKGNIITESELLEWSFVPVPANPFALKLDSVKENGIDLEMVRAKGIEIKTEDESEIKPDETKETEKKGMTEDILDNSSKLRNEKYGYVSPMTDAWWDFLDAFFSDATPISAIGMLVDELCTKYKAIASGDETGGQGDEEMETVALAMTGMAIKSNISKGNKKAEELTEAETKALGVLDGLQAFMAVERAKSGKVLSEKNRTLIQTSVEEIKSCAAALQELLDATEDQQGDGGKADDAASQKQRSNPEGSALLKDLDNYFTVRQVLRSINNITSNSLANIRKSLKNNSKI